MKALDIQPQNVLTMIKRLFSGLSPLNLQVKITQLTPAPPASASAPSAAATKIAKLSRHD